MSTLSPHEQLRQNPAAHTQYFLNLFGIKHIFYANEACNGIAIKQGLQNRYNLHGASLLVDGKVIDEKIPISQQGLKPHGELVVQCSKEAEIFSHLSVLLQKTKEPFSQKPVVKSKQCKMCSMAFSSEIRPLLYTDCGHGNICEQCFVANPEKAAYCPQCYPEKHT
jgi:hypothetical protein